MVHFLTDERSLAVTFWREGLTLCPALANCIGCLSGGRSAVCFPSRQLFQHQVVLPCIATLRQCYFAAGQDVLEARIDGIAKGTGIFGTEPLVEVSGAR